MRKYLEIGGIIVVLGLIYFSMSYFGYTPPLRTIDPYTKVTVYSVGVVDEINTYGFCFADSNMMRCDFVECDVKDSVEEGDVVLVKIEETPGNEIFKKIKFVKILHKNNPPNKRIRVEPSADIPK